MSDVVHYRGAQAPHAIRTLWWPACGLATTVAGPRVTRSKTKVTCRRCRAKLLGEQKRRAKPMPKVNRKRKAKRHAVTFGEQADLCRAMTCCGCCPAVYATPESIAEEIANARRWRALDVRFCDPHHTKTVGAGGRDEHCVPVCRDCHMEIHAPNSGPKTFDGRRGIDSRAIAAAIRRAISSCKDHQRQEQQK